MILAGDFMQLPPFEGRKRVSLLKPPAPMKPGGKVPDVVPVAGYDIFQNCVTDCVLLTRTFRFRDQYTGKKCPLLEDLFAYMREAGPNGTMAGGMPKHLWEGLKEREVRQVRGIVKDERLKADRPDSYQYGGTWKRFKS